MHQYVIYSQREQETLYKTASNMHKQQKEVRPHTNSEVTCCGHPNMAKGKRADENHVSRTSVSEKDMEELCISTENTCQFLILYMDTHAGHYTPSSDDNYTNIPFIIP